MNLGDLQKLIGNIQLESGNANVREIKLSPWDYYDTKQALKDEFGKIGIRLVPDVKTPRGIVRVVHNQEVLNEGPAPTPRARKPRGTGKAKPAEAD